MPFEESRMGMGQLVLFRQVKIRCLMKAHEKISHKHLSYAQKPYSKIRKGNRCMHSKIYGLYNLCEFIQILSFCVFVPTPW